MSSAGAAGISAARLRPELARRVAVVARAAALASTPVRVLLVGGTVRDLLLDRDSPDLDFVVLGDAEALAAAVQSELGGRLIHHRDFLTVDLVDGEGHHLDFATARCETYRAVAALPDVRSTDDLAADLGRRDFTVNAMALPLGDDAGWAERHERNDRNERNERRGGPPELPGLVDPTGGRADLAAGRLRVLHDRSFTDDPTRILRGVRFEARLGFRLAPETDALAREAAAGGVFSQLSGGRLQRELALLLGALPLAALGLPALARLDELGVLRAIHPALGLERGAAVERLQRLQRLQAVAAEHAWYVAAGAPEPRPEPWVLLLMGLTAGLDAETRREAAVRLALAGRTLELIAAPGAAATAVAGIAGRLAAPEARAAEVDRLLAPLAGEELLLLAATGGALVRSWVRRYWLEMLPFRLAVTAGDLLAAGVAPGPAIGRALRATRAARLDGELGAEGELLHALACAATAAGEPGV